MKLQNIRRKNKSMADFYFVDRRTEEPINFSLPVYDGTTQNLMDCSNHLVGDEILILFEIDECKAEAAKDSGLIPSGAIFQGVIQIPFVVVKRSYSHAVDSKRFNHSWTLSSLSRSIHLKATSAAWEDIFLWLAIGKAPRWAKEDEQ